MLTAVLVLSTGVAGVLPQLLDATAVGLQPSSAGATPSACCCGTTTGNCCKAGACDSRNAPTPEPVPAPTRDTTQSPILGLVYSQVSTPKVLHSGMAHVVEGETPSRSMADATLQTAQVRLDT